MINGKTILAIIPARGGSKGLVGKNTKILCGKPLIAWSVEAGLNSQYVDELMVTTDSQDIADIAQQYGANIPFLRPDHLATDSATSFDAIKHAIDDYPQKFDYILLLEPTSPLRTTADIDAAIEQLLASNAQAIVGISRTVDQNPAFLVKTNEGGYIEGFVDPEMKPIRRQDIEDVYFFEGSVYVSETDALLEHESFYHAKTIGYEVPKYKSLEIDDIDDFVMVEALMKYRGYIK